MSMSTCCITDVRTRAQRKQQGCFLLLLGLSSCRAAMLDRVARPRAAGCRLARAWRHVRAHAADIGNGDGEPRPRPRHGAAPRMGAHGTACHPRPAAGIGGRSVAGRLDHVVNQCACARSGRPWRGAGHMHARPAAHCAQCPQSSRSSAPTREHRARTSAPASWSACASFPGLLPVPLIRLASAAHARTRACRRGL